MSTQTNTVWTVNKIKDAVRAEGSHWFDPDTMSCFGTVVLPTVYQGPGGVYFVTEDNQYDRALPKRYTVRRFDPEGADISTVGKLCGFKTEDDAIEAARDNAGLDADEAAEEFEPVTHLEQFVADLCKHSPDPSKVTVLSAKLMMANAKRHHHLMELLCSDEQFCKGTDEEGNHPQVTNCRARIEQCAKRLGATGVLFSGDPRGCTVKLVFEDGATNDFGKEGWCVPLPD